MNEPGNIGNIRAEAVPPPEMFDHRSYVYFAAVCDAIKIGFSTLPYIRQGQLHPQKRSLWMLGVTPGGMADEAALHKKFAHLRVELYGEREWFRVAPDLVQFLDDLEASGDFIHWAVYVRRMHHRFRYYPQQRTLYRKSAQLLHGYFPQVMERVTA